MGNRSASFSNANTRRPPKWSRRGGEKSPERLESESRASLERMALGQFPQSTECAIDVTDSRNGRWKRVARTRPSGARHVDNSRMYTEMSVGVKKVAEFDASTNVEQEEYGPNLETSSEFDHRVAKAEEAAKMDEKRKKE